MYHVKSTLMTNMDLNMKWDRTFKKTDFLS